MDESESNSSGGSLALKDADDVLAHFGKLGMKWGHRRTTSSTSDEGTGAPVDHPVTVKSRPGKGIVETKGGEGRLVSEDAKLTATYKQIAKKSGTDALSNKQLQSLNARLGLEQSYQKIANQPAIKSNGRKFVENAIKNEGKSFFQGKKGPLAIAAIAIGAAVMGSQYKSTHSAGSPTRAVEQAIAAVAARKAGATVASAGGKSTAKAGAEFVARHATDSPLRTVASFVAQRASAASAASAAASKIIK